MKQPHQPSKEKKPQVPTNFKTTCRNREKKEKSKRKKKGHHAGKVSPIKGGTTRAANDSESPGKMKSN